MGLAGGKSLAHYYNIRHEDLQQYVTNDMEDFCNSLSEKELIQEIEYTLDGDMLDEMITTIMEDL